MEWYEYIIIIIAIGLVILPIYLSIMNKKKGKKCCCDCNFCNNKADCCKNFKQFMDEYKKEKDIQ